MMKKEKGSITLFTLIAMMFFLTIAFTAYASAMAKLQAQNEDLERIKASYEQDLTPEGLASLYEELTTKKPYTVTFDANGGTVDLPSKEVKYGKEYGNLPTPIRDGYKFIGWNGKNLFNEDSILMAINGAENVNDYYKLNPQKAYFKYKDGIYDNNTFKENTQYTISLKGYNTMTNYSFGGLVIGFRYEDGSSGSSVYLKSETEIEMQLTSKEGKTVKNVYMSYGNPCDTYLKYIQLEEGNHATEYEPYYITSDTKVTQKKDHTLKAIWEEGVPPILELSKETYIEENFSDWELENARVIEEDGRKVLFIGEDGNAGIATSNYYETQGERWVPYYETFTTEPYNNSDKGSTFNNLYYYNQNYSRTNDFAGNSANGVSFKCDLNKWTPSTVDYRYKLDTKYIAGYGNDIKYIKIRYNTGSIYSSQSPVKIRNFKMIGEAIPNSFYDIKITASDNVGVTTTKYAKGEQTKEYFETNGINVENNQIRVTENGIYTVCVGDKAGNKTVKTIEITNIQ